MLKLTITTLVLAGSFFAPDADAGWKLKPGKTRVASIPASGPILTHWSTDVSLSGDGRLVCFVSDIDELTSHGNFLKKQVVVVDRETGLGQLVSETSGGQPAGEVPIGRPRISADGQYVVFSTRATGLPDGISVGDALGHIDVFRTHLSTGTTIRVSVTHDGMEPNDDCFDANLSADGRYVVFRSAATNLVGAGTDGTTLIYRVDTFVLTPVLVSAANGTPANAECHAPSISAGGGEVVYRTSATNLGVVPIGGATEAWLREIASGTNELISAKKNGDASEFGGDWPVISGDGRYVAFVSRSSDLPGAQSGGVPGLFVRDRKKGKTMRAPFNGKKVIDLWPYGASTDRYVTFMTDSTAGFRVYVWDIKKKKIKAVDLNSKGKRANAWVLYPAISANGKVVAFESNATNLGQDADASADVFVRRWK